RFALLVATGCRIWIATVPAHPARPHGKACRRASFRSSTPILSQNGRNNLDRITHGDHTAHKPLARGPYVIHYNCTGYSPQRLLVSDLASLGRFAWDVGRGRNSGLRSAI